MSDFQTFFFKFSERLTPSVWGVRVHKETASYLILQDKPAQVTDVRLYHVLDFSYKDPSRMKLNSLLE